MSKTLKTQLVVITLISLAFAGWFGGQFLSASTVDTGWIDATRFTGSVDFSCGRYSGNVWGQTGLSFAVPAYVLNLSAGSYSIDIEANYGFYTNDSQAPQYNERMTVETT